MASYGDVVGYVGLSTWLFNLVKSTQILTSLFGFGTITIGWHHSVGSSPRGAMIFLATMSSIFSFTYSRYAKGIGLAAVILYGS